MLGESGAGALLQTIRNVVFPETIVKTSDIMEILQRNLSYYAIKLSVSNLRYVLPGEFDYDKNFHSTVHVTGTTYVYFVVNYEGPLAGANEGELLKKFHLFIKITPPFLLDQYRPDVTAVLLKKLQIEMRFYQEIIDAIFQFQLLKCDTLRPLEGKSDFVTFNDVIPVCHGMKPNWYQITEASEDFVMLFEELEDYVHLNPAEGLDFPTAEFVLIRLAAFNATSLAFRHNKRVRRHTFALFRSGVPSDRLVQHFDEFLESTFSSPEVYCTQYQITYIMDKVRQIPSLLPHLIAIEKSLQYSYVALKHRPDDKWISYCHGRMFIYNMKLKKDPNNPNRYCSMKFLDFKHLNLRHILSDLVFLLTTCSSSELLSRSEAFEKLTRTYHENFYTYAQVQMTEYLSEMESYSYDNFMMELMSLFKVELLKSVQQIKYLAAQERYRDDMRALASFPNLPNDQSEHKVDKILHLRLLETCFHNLLGANIIDCTY